MLPRSASERTGQAQSPVVATLCWAAAGAAARRVIRAARDASLAMRVGGGAWVVQVGCGGSGGGAVGGGGVGSGQWAVGSGQGPGRRAQAQAVRSGARGG